MPAEQPPLPDVPEWLARVSSDTMNTEPFPLHDILRDSLYYPASSFDGDPVEYLAGCIASFIYVDFSHTRGELETELKERGFLGYECIGSRSVTEQELVPHGWRPEYPAPEDEGRRIWKSQIKPPFCVWSIFARNADFPPSHGPSRFSWLYLCADGRAAFQALYLSNRQRPKAVAVIQPGDPAFVNPEGLFARNVLGNPVGSPDFLLYGGVGGRHYYDMAPWPGYRAPLCVQCMDRGCILRECGVDHFAECREACFLDNTDEKARKKAEVRGIDYRDKVAYPEVCFLGNTSISVWFRDS